MRKKMFEIITSRIRADTELSAILDSLYKGTVDEKSDAFEKLEIFSGKGRLCSALLDYAPKRNEQCLEDALKDDEILNKILSAKEPEDLLQLENEINNMPLTLFERHIYQECIEYACRTKFGTYSPRNAVEEKASKAARAAYEAAMKKSMTDAISTVIISQLDDERQAIAAQSIALLDDSGQPSGWYRQIVSRVDVLNDNGRLYPRPVYVAALDALEAKAFPYPGESPHPASYTGGDGKIHFRTSVSNSVVKFRKAMIDENGYVWAEFKTMDTAKGREVQAFLDEGLPIAFSNRMTGSTVRRTLNDCAADVATKLELYCWDVVLNPAESASFGRPMVLTDEQLEALKKSKEESCMDELLKMDLDALKKWKEANAGHKDMGLCDHLIAQMEQQTAAEKALEDMKAEREREEKARKAQQALSDTVAALPYSEATKQAIIKKGEALTDEAQVADFVKGEQTIVDTVTINSKLSSLGVTLPQEGKAKTIMQQSTERNNLDVFTDSLMNAMDHELSSKDKTFKPDLELRKANKAILDEVFKQLERNNDKTYQSFMAELNDSVSNMSITDGIITDSVIGSTNSFAQAAAISRAVLYQAWQDVSFLQLCLVEGFSGSVMEMLVEFQSDDLFAEDDFVVGELEGIPTEGVETYVLKMTAEWLKRGFVITKEAMAELKTGPFKYDPLVRNLASIANRFTMIIDRKISTEMLARADEYEAKAVTDETVTADDLTAIAAGTNAPAETNATFVLQLKCGNSSLDDIDVLPPVVRPRTAVYLDEHGRTEKNYLNDVLITDSADKPLIRGRWLASKGKVVAFPGETAADYAVDFENAKVYFATTAVSTTALPKIKKYSYATNITFFCVDVPSGTENAVHYNQLLEKIDSEKAYMGSAPRFVTPDVVVGSLNAMVMVKQAKLFWQLASPRGTQLLMQGRNYFAERFGLTYMEHNCPWDAGDSRLLLATKNATHVGMGSPYSVEGPLPYYTTGGQITSAQQYFVSQQIAINTPLVIDSAGKQYHPPFRTIKLYSK